MAWVVDAVEDHAVQADRSCWSFVSIGSAELISILEKLTRACALHSFGSFLTSALIGAYSQISSAAILTGYVPNRELSAYPLAGYGLDYAPQNNPVKYGDRGSGYVSCRSAFKARLLCFLY